MPGRTLIAVAIMLAAAAAGVTVSRGLDIRIEERRPGFVPASEVPLAPAEPLPIRLVDAGGVGISADTAAWGGSYSHGTGAFHALVQPGSARVVASARARIESDWQTYVDRMAAYDITGIVVPAFLELIDFDAVDDGQRVYPRSGLFRARHSALRSIFADLFRYANDKGLGIYLKTDMLALSEPLERMILSSRGRVDASDAGLWQIYAAGIDELFARMEHVRGLIVRIGEAGSLYNLDGWEYRSEMAVRTPEQLRLMLRTLLPVFEKHGRDLVLRSWSVGVGPLGRLHTDPEVYQAVLGDIASHNLIVSTKFTQGDFFSFLPLNPTLALGTHRRIIEFQARREFEAFGAIPNFLAADHRSAIQAFASTNPNIAGMSLWTQEGGPLHAGPMSLYPVHGFWRWIDANVYATSRLIRDPSLDARTLAEDWVRSTLSTDPAVVSGISELLLRSRDAVRRGLYVSPFAARRIHVAGIEATPMMWIMEWDVIGDWSAIGSAVYRAARDRVDAAVAEGFAAVDDVAAMQATLERLAPQLRDHPEYDSMRRSLEYERSLFEALAWYRKTLLSYYSWLDTGSESARIAWQNSAPVFRVAAERHVDEFGGDLDFPAYDFASALAGLDRAAGSARARSLARFTLAAILVFAVLAFAPVRRARPVSLPRFPRTFRPSRRTPRAALDVTSLSFGFAICGLCAIATTSLFAFDAPRVAAGSVIVVASFSAALQGTFRGRANGARFHRSLRPVLAGAILTLALIAVRGSDHVWFLFWSDSIFRAAVVSAATATALWMLVSAFSQGRRAGFAPAPALGATFLAAGCALIVLTLLLPDLPALLAAFDRPLSMLPIRFALVAAVTEYAGLPSNLTSYPALAGSLLLLAGAALRFRRQEGSTTNRNAHHGGH